ncbi:MAG: HAMP domain-containing histidine kinase [Gemmatimonadaceae bacterium]|nr:HAMP domain-containing histidine kinase [Gemmatimonadaceae bacterium]
MKHSRFRTRLFVILALFAFVPALILTLAWSGFATSILPEISGTGAWQRVAESGERAIRLARERPGSPEADAALAEHQAQLGESRLQALRFGFVVNRGVRNAVIASLIAVVLLTIIASRVAGHLSRLLSRPLDELVTWTGFIARAERLPLPAADERRGAPEFSTLRDSMRQMATDLEAGRRATIEAERLSAFRESARQVAHELKNPLTPIRFAIASLRRSAAPEQQDALEVLDTESTRLEAMAKSFAQFGRLPEGPTARIDLADLAREAVRTIIPAQVVVTVDAAHEALVVGQHDALHRALSNVLLNAVDATGGRGPIHVRVAVESPRPSASGPSGTQEAVVVVKDEGVGIAPEAIERIWEPYVTAKTGGTGLGLAIVKQTVVAHGGRVDATSTPGQGTEIRLRFPLVSERQHGDAH